MENPETSQEPLPIPIITSLGEMADDVFLSVCFLTIADSLNKFLPFLHGHVLELTAKTACKKLGLDYMQIKSKSGHNLFEIFKLLQTKVPEIVPHLPTEEHFQNYQRVWVQTGAVLTKNINIDFLPPPSELWKWELAFFMDNVMNLKYGVDKEDIYVSILQMTNKSLNPDFLNLFTICRSVYSIPRSNRTLKGKLIGIFQETEDTRKIIEFLKLDPK